MEYIYQDILSDSIVPVILGNGKTAEVCAKRIFRKYGVLCHLFGEKNKPLMRGFARHHRVPHSKDEELMFRVLCDFSDDLEHKDLILYLIPCEEEYAVCVFLHREELERRYVIADKEEMEKVWNLASAD